MRRKPRAASKQMLKRGGVWVCTRFTGAYIVARLLAPIRGRKVRLVTVKAKGQQLEQIGSLMSKGKVEVVAERTFPITEMAAAHAESATGRVRGKIAISVS